MKSKFKIAIFASGAGSNALKIIQYFENNNNIQIDLIVSNKSNAYVLDIAKHYNIKTIVIKKINYIKKFSAPFKIVLNSAHCENNFSVFPYIKTLILY